MVKETIEWNDFHKVQMCVGTIIQAEDFPQARNPAYKLLIDFGAEFGVRKSSAQITKRYKRADLIGRQVVAVLNFPKKQIGNFMSECLVLGAMGEKGDVVLLHPGIEVPNGLQIG